MKSSGHPETLNTAAGVTGSVPARPDRRAVSALRLGDLLVAEGVVTAAQVAEAVRLQERLDRYLPLGHILLSQRLITRQQLVSVLERHRRSSRLGALLIKNGDITAEQLQDAVGGRTRQPLGDSLIRLGYISEERLRQALCRQLHIRFVSLDTLVLDTSLRTVVNEKFALKHRVVPLSRVNDTLTLAMDDPTQTRVVDDLQRLTGLRIEVVTATARDIDRALSRLYKEQVNASLKGEENVEVIPDAGDVAWDRGDTARALDSADTIVRKLLRVALDRRVSDIHLETVDRRLVVRFRIDGVLQHFNLGALAEDLDHQRPEVLSRIKILSGLDIAERRRPQDGSFRARVRSEGRLVTMDFRVSVIPGYYGENAVIRVLDTRRAPDSLDALSFTGPITARLKQLIRSSTGVILVTGPTGSGKSTTLHALLNTLYRPEIKVLTAEDPIEYVCERFSQHEVNDRIGNTFAHFLRAFLRHDPEVIMLGEIRDAETAELAFRAAQTGHLILSTLHTNDALGAITRLQDLGVDPNILTSTLLGVLSQRLVRDICWNCKEPSSPPAALLDELFEVPPAMLRWYRGAGCPACHHTGYRGRLALAELWTPTDDDVILINKRAPFEELRASARKRMLSMSDDVSARLQEGRTTLEELMRVLPHSTLAELRMMMF